MFFIIEISQHTFQEDVKNYEVKQKRRKEGVVGHAEEAFELISRPSTYSRNLSIYKCIET